MKMTRMFYPFRQVAESPGIKFAISDCVLFAYCHFGYTTILKVFNNKLYENKCIFDGSDDMALFLCVVTLTF